MMNLSISGNDKKKLGTIISYLRKNQYSKIEPLDWIGKDFIVDDFGDSICSRRTLSKIENGEIVFDEDIYDNLLKKLGLKYNYNGMAEEDELNHLFQKLNRATQYINKDEEEEIIKEILKIYKAYDIFAIESVIYNTLKFFFDNKEKLDDKKIKDLILLYDIYPDSLQLVLRRTSIFYCYEYSNKSLLNELSEKFKLSDLESTLDKYIYIIVLKVNKRYITAIERLISLKDISKNNRNNLLEIECLIHLCDFARLIDSKELVELSLKLEKVLNNLKSNSNSNNLGIYYYNLGLFFDNSNMPHHSLNYYLESISLNNKLFLRAAFEAFNVCEKNNLEIPKEFVQNEYLLEVIPSNFSSNEDILLILYNYYLRKHYNKAPVILEDYITRNIVKLFKEINDLTLYNIFEHELLQLVNKTGNKNKLYNFRRLKIKMLDEN